MGYVPIEDTECYQRFVALFDEIWRVVMDWDEIARNTVGTQFVRATDSVGANMVEGAGRFSYAEEIRFLIIARASARETLYWLRRAAQRDLISSEQSDKLIASWTYACRQLNTMLTHRRQLQNQQTGNVIRELPESYDLTLPNDLMTQ